MGEVGEKELGHLLWNANGSEFMDKPGVPYSVECLFDVQEDCKRAVGHIEGFGYFGM